MLCFNCTGATKPDIFKCCCRLHWFSCRQTNSTFKVISMTEYNKRKELVALPMLMFGIHLIVHEDYTFQLTKTETKTTNGVAKTADVDWYEEEIYSRLPYAKELLPVDLCLQSSHAKQYSRGSRRAAIHFKPLILWTTVSLSFYRFTDSEAHHT